MAEQELKACPWCAGPAAVERDRGWIYCRTRGCDGGYRERAIWNTRPLESALTSRLASAEAEVERLRGRNAVLVDHIYGCTGFVGDRAVEHPLTTDELTAAAARRQQGGTDAR